MYSVRLIARRDTTPDRICADIELSEAMSHYEAQELVKSYTRAIAENWEYSIPCNALAYLNKTYGMLNWDMVIRAA